MMEPNEMVRLRTCHGTWVGALGADNALHPNPLYAFAGTFRAMCNRGRLGHVPMRPPPDIANAPPPYALADMISGAWTAPGRRAAFLRAYPGSLAAEYLAATTAASDFAVLARCALRRRNHHAPYPATAVHLRTGDVLDAAPQPLADFLAKPTKNFNGGFYVKPAAFYEALDIPPDKTVTLFTGFHLRTRSTAKSLAYVAAVRAILEGRGFAVAESIDADPDADFVKMVFAETFVPSGGGFSAAIAATRLAIGGLDDAPGQQEEQRPR